MKTHSMLDVCDLNLNLVNFSTHTANKSRRKLFVCKKGMRPYSRFFYIRNGKAFFKTKNADNSFSEIPAVKGDIVYFPDDVEYECRWENANDIDYINLTFNLEDEDKNPVLLSDAIRVIARDRYESFIRAFEKLFDTFQRGELGYKIKCRALFFDILHEIALDGVKTSLKKKNSPVYKGIFFLENNYLDDISVNHLAAMCGICPASFRKHFQSAVGMPPVEYKNYLRIKKAAELLKTGEYTVTEAADAVNCSDVYYFSKLFKRFFNITAKKYMLSQNRAPF